MSLKLNSSGGGSVTLQEPATASALTLNLPAVNGTVVSTGDTGSVTSGMLANGSVTAAAVAAGAVVQVLQSVKTDTFSTNSASYVDVTGLSVSITPSSASNRILVTFHIHGAYTNIGMCQLVRNSTAIALGDAAGSRQQGTVGALHNSGDPNAMWVFSMTFLDSPATTSATTYKLQVRGESATNPIVVNRSVSDANTPTGLRGISSITVMEVKG